MSYWPGDWDLLHKVNRAAHTPSEAELEDGAYHRRLRNSVLYAEPDTAPLKGFWAWLFGDDWTDSSRYRGECVRGNVTIKGIHFAVMEASGEINPSR